MEPRVGSRGGARPDHEQRHPGKRLDAVNPQRVGEQQVAVVSDHSASDHGHAYSDTERERNGNNAVADPQPKCRVVMQHVITEKAESKDHEEDNEQQRGGPKKMPRTTSAAFPASVKRGSIPRNA